MSTRYLPWLAFAALSVPALAQTDPSSFDGFVTNVVSATEFDVGTRHILCDAATKWKRPKTLPDYATSVRVGTLVRIDGKSRKGAFTAKSVEVSPRKSKLDEKIGGRGLIERGQRLSSDPQGWIETIWVEGFPLEVGPNTSVLDAAGSEQPAAEINTNMWATYEAVRDGNGALVADRISLEANHVNPDEKEYRDKADPELIPADPGKHKPARLRFGNRAPVKFDLLPEEVQDYLSKVGNGLVPQYQRDLPATDPTKIKFRFYAVKIPNGWVGNMQDKVDLPNGVVLVSADVLSRLENEAQLAAYLAYCIAHVLEKQDFLNRARLHRDMYAVIAGDAAGLYGLPVVATFDLKLQKLAAEIDERCDRIALTYMLPQGYDIREAALSLLKQDGTSMNNPLDEDEKPPARVEKLMEELQLDYAKTDYSSLKKSREAYAEIRAEAQAAAK